MDMQKLYERLIVSNNLFSSTLTGQADLGGSSNSSATRRARHVYRSLIILIGVRLKN